MECTKLLSIIGLIFNTIASIVLIWPYLFPNHLVNDDLIEKIDTKTGKYLQRKHLAERKISMVGFSLLSIGFIFQLLGIAIF